MDEPQANDVTEILNRMSTRPSDATEELFPILYDELHNRASRMLDEERGSHTLQATALVHEAYLRIVRQEQMRWNGKSHFLALAATMMRRILVDHARKRLAKKRSADRRVTLTGQLSELAQGEDAKLDVLDLEIALQGLQAKNERLAKIAELRVFAGLTLPECAEVLEVSRRTAESDWALARAWLMRALTT